MNLSNVARVLVSVLAALFCFAGIWHILGLREVTIDPNHMPLFGEGILGVIGAFILCCFCGAFFALALLKDSED